MDFDFNIIDEEIDNFIEAKNKLATLGVIVGSQKSIMEYCPSNDYTVAIRIVSPGEEFLKLEHEDKFKEILKLEFNEALYVSKDSFNSNTAETIIDFFEKHRNAKTFVFHCEAGVKRSPAVAKALGIFLSNDEIVKSVENIGIPHKLVLKILEEEIQKRNYICNSLKSINKLFAQNYLK